MNGGPAIGSKRRHTASLSSLVALQAAALQNPHLVVWQFVTKTSHCDSEDDGFVSVTECAFSTQPELLGFTSKSKTSDRSLSMIVIVHVSVTLVLVEAHRLSID